MGPCRTAGVSLCPNQDFDISTSPRHQKMECTELRLTRWVAAFPWPRFSDARILGSKYRNLGFDCAKPRRAGTNQFIFCFLRASVPPWCKGLAFGCGCVTLCKSPVSELRNSAILSRIPG